MTEETPEYEPGSVADFDRLYRHSYWKIVATLTGVLGGDRPVAEDCAQEAFAKAFRAWGRWRPDAPAEAWLHRIALNVALGEKRRQKRHEVGELVRRLGWRETTVDPAEPPSELGQALGSLKLEEAAIVILRHHHGYSNREIAAALGVPESTISSKLVAAKRKLQKRLQPRSDVVNQGAPDVVSIRNP